MGLRWWLDLLVRMQLEKIPGGGFSSEDTCRTARAKFKFDAVPDAFFTVRG